MGFFKDMGKTISTTSRETGDAIIGTARLARSSAESLQIYVVTSTVRDVLGLEDDSPLESKHITEYQEILTLINPKRDG